MAEIINLRMARKARDRQDKADKASANRALHARTKGEKLANAADKARAASQLDGAKRETD